MNDGKRKRLVALLVTGVIASFVFATGCGGDGGEEKVVDTTQTEACVEYWSAYCRRMIDCEVINNESFGECLTLKAEYCPDLLFAEGSAITVESAGQCADEWRTTPCRYLREGLEPDCARTGTLVDGEPCIADRQCASGACSSYGMRACGVCTAQGQYGEGASCTGQYRGCDQGYVCDPTSSKCVPRLQVGDDCTGNLSGCSPNLCLEDRTSGSNRCFYDPPRPKLGEDCTATRACDDPGVYCDLHTLTCLSIPGVGDDCGVDSFVGDAIYCTSDAYCDQSVDPAVCRKRPAAGEACYQFDDGYGICDLDSRCDTSLDPPTCASLPHAGEPCYEGRCASDLFCGCAEEFCAARTCLRLRLPGESCAEPGDHCLDGASACKHGVCVAVQSQGLFEKLCR